MGMMRTKASVQHVEKGGNSKLSRPIKYIAMSIIWIYSSFSYPDFFMDFPVNFTYYDLYTQRI